MALHIRDPETDRLVRTLAEIKNLGLTETIRLAVEKELKQIPVRERVRALQDRIAAYPKTGLKADKDFYDSLNDE